MVVLGRNDTTQQPGAGQWAPDVREPRMPMSYRCRDSAATCEKLAEFSCSRCIHYMPRHATAAGVGGRGDLGGQCINSEGTAGSIGGGSVDDVPVIQKGNGEVCGKK